ncbi:MAG: hypothetical protein WC835_00970 [Candidatus Paceibacterota bacterium]|jgi:hypothetical protein
MNYVSGKISELFDKLPEEVKHFVYDPATDEKIKSIGNRYSLTPEKIDLLTDETQYVIIGYKPAEDLAVNLKAPTGLPDETARRLAEEIKEQIIKPARTPSKPATEEPEEDKRPGPTENEIEGKFRSLPKDVRDAITSADVDLKVTELAGKYRLHIDKAEELSDETGLVMLGLTKPQDYLKNLKQRLELPEDMARDLVTDVNEQIFKPIRESLKQIHGMESSSPQPIAKTEQPMANYREAITDEDIKVMADNGMEIITDNNKQTTSDWVVGGQEIPQKHELIVELEEPIEVKKGEVMGGQLPPIAPVNIPTTTPMASPSEKLTVPVKTPPTEATYTPSSEPPKKQPDDPYREAVN